MKATIYLVTLLSAIGLSGAADTVNPWDAVPSVSIKVDEVSRKCPKKCKDLKGKSVKSRGDLKDCDGDKLEKCTFKATETLTFTKIQPVKISGSTYVTAGFSMKKYGDKTTTVMKMKPNVLSITPNQLKETFNGVLKCSITDAKCTDYKDLTWDGTALKGNTSTDALEDSFLALQPKDKSAGDFNQYTIINEWNHKSAQRTMAVALVASFGVITAVSL